MWSIFSKIRSTPKSSSTHPADDLPINQSVVSDDLLKSYGLRVVRDDKGNEYLVPDQLVPKGTDDFDTFIKYWFDSTFLGSITRYTEHFKLIAYDDYNIMDSNSSELSLMLDTYADESLGLGPYTRQVLSIKISNKDAERKVLSILERSGLVSHDPNTDSTVHRSNIRSLIKYGDFYLRISGTTDDNIRVSVVNSPAQVSVVVDPELNTVLSYKYIPHTDLLKIAKSNRSIVASDYDYAKDLYPWDMVHMMLYDSCLFPYGKSVLSHLREPYHKLLINEALLALSRSSRVERLVVRVPVQGANPVAAFMNLQSVKDQVKNVLFGTATAKKSAAKLSSLTDILFMPSNKDYSIDRLSSNIDVASIDDIEYFRDKLLMATKLPKSYLLADDSYRNTASALAAQDIKFARALLPIQQAYTSGFVRLIAALLLRLGYDITDIKIEVSMNAPQAFRALGTDNTGESVRIANDLLDSYMNKPESISDESWVSLTSRLTGISAKYLMDLITNNLSTDEVFDNHDDDDSSDEDDSGPVVIAESSNSLSMFNGAAELYAQYSTHRLRDAA